MMDILAMLSLLVVAGLPEGLDQRAYHKRAAYGAWLSVIGEDVDLRPFLLAGLFRACNAHTRRELCNAWHAYEAVPMPCGGEYPVLDAFMDHVPDHLFSQAECYYSRCLPHYNEWEKGMRWDWDTDEWRKQASRSASLHLVHLLLRNGYNRREVRTILQRIRYHGN